MLFLTGTLRSRTLRRAPLALTAAALLSTRVSQAQDPIPSDKPDEVRINGTALSHTPGSAQVVKKEQLERFEYDDPGAVLQQVPGVYVRGEDGVGLRPNLGIRGANPDRSKKLTLMEDGILFGPAPYSAPAAYYFPLLTRMTQVRVIKGPGAIAYGPQSVGGAIDFISRPIPGRFSGAADVAGGQYGYYKTHAYVGSSELNDGRLGFLIEGVRLGNTGFANLPNGADTGSTRDDFMIKAGYLIDPSAKTKHYLQLKLAYADEVSNETYLGQTDADFRKDAYNRYPASSLDQMKNHRTGIVATHTMEGAESAYQIKTSVYRFDYQRTWSKLNRLGNADAATVLRSGNDPTYAGYYAVLTGRADSSSAADTLFIGPNNRTFVSQGVQSVMSTTTKTGPLEHRFETGMRFHYDEINRLHTESAFLMQAGQVVPAGEPVITTTDNRDSTHAFAIHLTDAMTWNGLTVTPGARVEIIQSRSRNFLASTDTQLLTPAIMPGVGAYYEILEYLGALAGVYRGFSPPAPGTEGAKPEYSVNYEAGFRYTRRSSRAELIGFYNDYSNLTDVCTLASGCVNAALDRQFDAGKARIYGLESSVTHEQRLPHGFKLPMSAAYTLTYGEFLSDFTSQDPIYGVVRKGDEIPYIPLHQLNVTTAVEHRRFGVNGAVTYVARMREQAGTGDIDRAELKTDEQLWLDLGAYVNVFRWLRLYSNLRNVFGVENIIGHRPYGARPNAPRWLQIGAKFSF
jgi:Fe(3+) dicitrate transport protein